MYLVAALSTTTNAHEIHAYVMSVKLFYNINLVNVK